MRAGSSRLAHVLARSSAYPRTETHLSQQTLPGAVLSLSAVVLVLCLLVSELREFLNVESSKRARALALGVLAPTRLSPPTPRSQLGVDTRRGQTELPVLLDITFPALPCAVINLEAVDLAGAHDWDSSAGVVKTRLDAQGHSIGVYTPPAGEFDLFSIFGAVNAQILRMSGLFSLLGPEAMREMQEAVAAHEGCRLYGSLPVPRVAGDFHVSVSASGYQIVREEHDGVVAELNISHIIHKLNFGPAVPGADSPLDNFVRIIPEGHRSGTYKYFLKLVPTQFRRLNGNTLHTHQYSVTEYFTASKANDGILPAVFFSYDFSPVMLTVEERRRPLLHFLTRICAVVGGVFALFEMFAKLITV